MPRWAVTAPADTASEGTAPARPASGDRPARRVREDVRDGVAVFCFSLGASTLVALVLTLLPKLAG